MLLTGWNPIPSFYTNKTGFSARASGQRTRINGRINNGFMEMGRRAFWQTSTILPPNGSIGEKSPYVILDRWYVERFYGLNTLNSASAAVYNVSFSVRCIKN